MEDILGFKEAEGRKQRERRGVENKLKEEEKKKKKKEKRSGK